MKSGVAEGTLKESVWIFDCIIKFKIYLISVALVFHFLLFPLPGKDPHLLSKYSGALSRCTPSKTVINSVVSSKCPLKVLGEERASISTAHPLLLVKVVWQVLRSIENLVSFQSSFFAAISSTSR